MSIRKSAGFSLIQFAISLMLVGGLALGMAPMYYKFMNNYRATSFANGLVQSLQLARSKAVKHGSAVSVCASDNGRTCTDTPWSRGYIVFADSGSAGVVDGDDSVIEITRSRSQHVNVTLTGGNYVRFLPNGGLLAQAPSDTADNLQPTWFARLSPIATALANDDRPQTAAFTVDDSPAKAVHTGAFTVCVGPSGRAINISYLGRITTSRIPCE